MQPAGVRAIGHRIANDADAVPRFEGILRPSETLQDRWATGDDGPFNGFTRGRGFKHNRECRMRVRPVERLDRPFERTCLVEVVCRIRVMRDRGQRREGSGTTTVDRPSAPACRCPVGRETRESRD